MQVTHTEASLKAAIEALELERSADARQLKSQLMLTYDHIQPINLIKRTFREVGSSRELKTQMVSSAIGMAVGYLAKSLYVGKSANPVRKMIGAALMYGVSDLISNNPELVSSAGKGIARWITSGKGTPDTALPESPEKALHE